MIKRSIAVTLFLTATALAHTHGEGHKRHYAAYTSSSPIVRDIIPPTKNDEECAFYSDDTLYVLKSLINEKANYKVDIIDERLAGSIEFSICRSLQGLSADHPCQGAYACYYKPDGTQHPLSGTDFKKSIVSSVMGFNNDDRVNDTSKGGLTLDYVGGNFECEGDKDWQLRLLPSCDDNYDDNELGNLQVSGWSSCKVHVTFSSSAACYKFSLNSLFRYIGRYAYLFGALMIAAGIFVGFLGKKLIKPTICMVGMLAFILLSSWLIFTFAFTRDSSDTIEWVVFGVCCLVGVFVGLLLAYLARFGAAVLTAWGGVCLGLMLYTAFVYKIDNDKQVVFWIFVILMGVAFGLLGYFLFNHAVIISTSIIGAYLVIRGISMYAGHFPNEQVILERLKNGLIADFDTYFFIYLGGFAVLTLGCIVFQYRFFYKAGKQQEHPYHRFK